MTVATIDRSVLVRRGLYLSWFTIGWNFIEGVVSIASGLLAGSIALVGFGFDSYIEVFAGSVILWRLSKEKKGETVAPEVERRAVKLIALTFLALAAGAGTESVRRLVTGDQSGESLFGIGVAVLSLIVMPFLAREKMKVGRQLGSRAVEADATETKLCVWLSAILLVGLGLNAALGWWWADPLAGLGITYVAAREGIDYLRSEEIDDCC